MSLRRDRLRGHRIARFATFLWILASALTVPTLPAQESWSIPWLEGTSMSKATIVKKRFGRLGRNDIWDDRKGGDIQYLVEYILEEFDPEKAPPAFKKDFTDMNAYARFYNARLMGRRLVFNPPQDEAKIAAKKKEIIQEIIRARDLGYTNYQEIKAAKELYPVEREKEFVELVEKLRVKSETDSRSNDSKRADELFALYAAGAPAEGEPGTTWKPALTTLDGQPFWPTNAGPSAIIVSRIHHDGLVKFAPALSKIHKQFGDKIHVGVAFYQIYKDDDVRRQQAKTWAGEIGLTLPATIIDRKEYRDLRELLKAQFDAGQTKLADEAKAAGKKPKPLRSYEIFQPVIVFLDAAGRPILQSNGVLRDWQLEYRTKKFLELVGAEKGDAKNDAESTDASEKKAETPDGE